MTRQRGLPGVLTDLAVLRKVSGEIMAALLGMKYATFRRRVSEGLEEAPVARGAYDAFAGLERQRKGSSVTPAPQGNYAAEQLRYLSARADVEELEAESRAGDLIPYAYAEGLWTETLALLRSEIDGNAGRLAHELAAETDPAQVRRRLLDEYRAACERAAAKITGLREPVVTAAPADGDDDDPAPESDG